MSTHEHTLDRETDSDVTLGRVYRALIRDAYLQVADNLVFRIMLVVVLVMVLTTFIVGFRDDHISILFGVAQLDYQSVLGSIGWIFGVVGGDNLGASFVEQIQSTFATAIAGTAGALFAVVATSFFVPRMLEKGAADTLFSKPVRRGVLVVSRYFGSIVFVGILSTVLVVGMWLGFAVASGYTEPEFLWSAPMLVYQFVLLSAFSTFFGAMTRSSIATLLLTILSWFGCFIVHTIWLFANANPSVTTVESDSTEDVVEAPAPQTHPVMAALQSGITIGHLVLPKVGDATELTRLVRETLHGETRRLLGGISIRHQVLAVFEQVDGTIVVSSQEGNEALFPQGRGTLLSMEARRPVFLRVNVDGSLEAWTGSVRDGRRARELALGDDAESEGAAPTTSREVELPDWAVPAPTVPPEDVAAEDPVSYYRQRFTWHEKELAFSPIYSIVSSLGFSLLLLLGATWRVRRIDF